MLFRITTTDDQVLGSTTNRKAAYRRAKQQCAQLNEDILIKRIEGGCVYTVELCKMNRLKRA